MPTLSDLLRPLVAGRKLVLAGAPLAAMTGMCRQLRELGAERLFLLATGIGTGEAPGPDEAEWCVVEVRAPDVVAEIWAAMRLLRLLPSEVVDALDRWDPQRQALVLSPMFNELPEIAGRRVYGPRRPEWRRLEDKVVVDELWDDFGVTRAPSEVMAAEPVALRAAARRLDRGAGTAWAGDARQGFNGGAFCLRWVRSDEDAAEAARFLGERCDRARVMPFLEGIPCSIHGMVFPHGVATFRPVELVTLRQSGGSGGPPGWSPSQSGGSGGPPGWSPSGSGRSGLRYAGAATFWDPPDADREVMRDLARRVGDGLRERVGYRGAFTVDGVLTAEGFLPTELNPRLGAGLATMTRGLPDLPVGLLDRALIEGEAGAVAAGDLERQVLEAADRARAGGAWTVTDAAADATRELPVTFEGGTCRPAAGGDPADGVLSFGPSGWAGSSVWPSTRSGCRPDRRWRRSRWPRSRWPTSGSVLASARWSRPVPFAERGDAPHVGARHWVGGPG